MNPHLAEFAKRYFSVVAAILFLVGVAAFLSLPYIFGRHPGDPSATESPLIPPPAATATASPSR